MTQTFSEFLDYLDRSERPLPLEEVGSRMRAVALDLEELRTHLRFTDAGYHRSLIVADKDYHLWLMCWKNGQRSPIHDHAGSGCAVRVVRGMATVTAFVFAANGHVKAVGSQDYHAREVILSRDADLHQISNLQGDNADLVTLHLYSPPLHRMGTYSLMDASRDEEVWVEETRKVVTAWPENSETPLDRVQGWVTPNRLFFVRNHFDVPTIDRNTWKLRIDGNVAKPREWTWNELTALPSRSVFATVECAGNGRSFLKHRVHGVQWGAGAIGHSEWTGVPVKTVLEESGIEPGTLELLFEGADHGAEADQPEPMHFARSLSLEKALHPDTLLVYRMNGELLEASHGYPLRLFVPGWYGVASVKWLHRIEALTTNYQGYYQTKKYTYRRQQGDETVTEIVGPMVVKSEIFRPQEGETLGIGTNRIFGVAWAGEEPVAAVEISTDAGQTWNKAELIGMQAPYSWTMWEYLWETADPGEYTILARASSPSGKVQPTDHNLLHGGYMIHHSRPTSVQVGQTAPTEEVRFSDAETLLYDMNAYAEENARAPLDVDLVFYMGEGI